ncbi:oxygen-insensitive NADPH nitroreductase [Alkalihalobacillus sp. 1P02AB]|uniref:oxygen-insensitive NADPH nitroreductase n=1 Tax=Alkalihalobacillus sp. 1P02AB TaxID=3132260 RepID=UPI0039A76AAA
MSHNEFNELIQSHRSIRKFTNEEVSDDVLENVIESARRAPTSHNVQAYSLLVIRDQEKKENLAKLSGNQKYVAECPVFFVIVADYYRLKRVSELHNEPFEVGEIEQVMVGSVDAALVAENLLLASRAYGLGGVMIGGIRNQSEEVAKVLQLPEYTFPVMGLCIGYPDQLPDQKPRLPKEAVVFYDQYDLEKVEEGLRTYDTITEQYYRERTNGQKTDPWSKQMATHFAKVNRPQVGEYLKKQGFLKG